MYTFANRSIWRTFALTNPPEIAKVILEKQSEKGFCSKNEENSILKSEGFQNLLAQNVIGALVSE